MTAEKNKSLVSGRSSRRPVMAEHANRSTRNSVVVPGVGLNLPRQLPFDKWLSIGKQLSTIASSSAWCLGDWLVYGEELYLDRYRSAIEGTSLDYQTLRNYAWVARRFALSRRRDTLSFGHHAEVAALSEPEQDFWLHKALEARWSRNQLRHEIRQSLRERGDGLATGDKDKSDEDRPDQMDCKMEVKPRPEELQLWEQAADNSRQSLQSWATCVLNQAARETLTDHQPQGGR